ncbi:hypothetical protein C8R43DRAFT_1138424 [Mycena crocata]|nr:hypothetical protein C8R43DRAFT_1138424 [Mycena crocata]
MLAQKCGQYCIFTAIVMLTLTGITICVVLPLGGVILWIKACIAESSPIEKDLLFQITNDTPISGFYGPGPWYAWLITLGMSHAHTAMALLNTGALPTGWDYDLIGAAFYTVAAAVDLMHKSRMIAQLGDKASESVLLPALVCAERVVAIGTGFFLVNLTVGVLSAASASSIRTARTFFVTATIPLLFVLVASGFLFHAHNAISHTAPVFWCSMHDGTPRAQRKHIIPFTHVDFLADIISTNTFLESAYWIVMGWVIPFIIPSVFLGCLLHSRNFPSALGYTALSVVILTATLFLAIPLLVTTLVIGLFAAIAFSCWVLLWVPLYAFAFFPRLGYFPPTGTSVLEMDQIAALLGVVLVAVIRISRHLRANGGLLKRHGVRGVPTAEAASIFHHNNGANPSAHSVALAKHLSLRLPPRQRANWANPSTHCGVFDEIPCQPDTPTWRIMVCLSDLIPRKIRWRRSLPARSVTSREIFGTMVCLTTYRLLPRALDIQFTRYIKCAPPPRGVSAFLYIFDRFVGEALEDDDVTRKWAGVGGRECPRKALGQPIVWADITW